MASSAPKVASRRIIHAAIALLGGVHPGPLFWSSVSRLQALSASQPGLVRPTKYTHFAAAAPFQPRKRVDLRPDFISLEAMEDKLSISPQLRRWITPLKARSWTFRSTSETPFV